MTAVIKRSFAESLGLKWPAGVAYRISDGWRGQLRDVTWAEVGEEKRRRQRERLERIRRPEPPRIVPAYVWTFFIPGWLYHGWHCYVVAREFEVPVTGRDGNTELADNIMRAVPLGIIPHTDHFDRWMAELAKRHPRKKPRNDRRRAGVMFGWLENRRRFTLGKPPANEWDRKRREPRKPELRVFGEDESEAT